MCEDEVVAINVQHLSKSFSKDRGLKGLLSVQPCFSKFFSKESRKQVLREVSFKVAKGEVFGVLGVNAAGKSTLLQLIAGLQVPESGEVLLFGEKPEQAKIVSIANPRELYEGFRALEQIRFIARLHQLDENVAVARAIELLDFLGVPKVDYKELYQSNLSLGTKGKVALVVGILPLLVADRLSTGILLLDEPTLGFDAFAKREFFEAFSAFREAFPEVTIVFGTNDSREVDVCSRSISLVKGKVVESRDALEALQQVVASSSRENQAFLQLVDPTRTGKLRNVAKFQLDPIPKHQYSAWSIFRYRTICDLSNNKASAVLIVLQLVLPNLLVLFSISQNIGLKSAFCLWVLGVYTTLLLRESMRFLDRERNYFKTLQTIWLSPMKRSEHLIATSGISWIAQTMYLMSASTILLLLLSAQMGLDTSDVELNAAKIFGLFCVVVGILLATQAAGLLTTYVPFTMTGVNSYFFQSMIPLFGVLCSGIYYSPSQLPSILRFLSELNPISYGAYAFRELLGLGLQEELYLVATVERFGIPLSSAYIAISIQMLLSLLYLLISVWFFKNLEQCVRRAGRFSTL